MAQLPLLEIAKTMSDPKQGAIVGTYAAAYHPTTVMPMETAPTGVMKWYRENALPYTTGGVRNFDGSWTRTYGTDSPLTETTRIYGGSFQADRQLIKINAAAVANQKQKQIEASARRFTIDMFEGADGTALRGIDDWLDNDPALSGQSASVGTSTTAAVLTTDSMDVLVSMIDKRPGNTFIYCTVNAGLMIRKLARGSITSSNSNYNINYSPEQFGYFSGEYDGIPIIVLKDGKGTNLLSNTLATSADGCEVYAVTYGTDALAGFQVNPMEVYALQDDTVYNFFDFEWPVGVAPKSTKCLARLQWVKDATS